MTGHDRPGALALTAVATYGTTLGTAVLSLFNVMLVAHVLGAAGRGNVALLMAIAMLSAYLSTIGVQEANANLGGSHPDLRPALATNSIVLAAVLGGGAALLVVALVALVPAVAGEAPAGLLWLALAAVPVLVLKIYLNLLLQSGYRFGATNTAWLIGPVTTATVNGVCAVTGALTVGTAIGAWVGGHALGVAFLLAVTRRGVGFARPDAGLMRRALSFGARTHVGRFMEIGNYRVDQWLVGAMAGARDLGHYSVAVAWAEVLFYVPGVIVLLQRPDLVRAQPREAAEIASRVLRRALFLAGIASIGLIAAAPVLCPLLLGAEFEASTAMLRVLALGALGIVVLELLGNALVAQRRPLRASAAIAVAFVVTIVLDLLLIPPMGGLGAAVATACAYSVGGAAVVVMFTRTLPGRLRDLVPRSQDVAWYGRKLRRVRGAVGDRWSRRRVYS